MPKSTAVKGENDNLRWLSELCEGLGFRHLAAQLSRFRNSNNFEKQVTMKDLKVGRLIPITAINPWCELFQGVLTFSAKRVTFECSTGHAFALSPAVREQLSLDT